MKIVSKVIQTSFVRYHSIGGLIVKRAQLTIVLYVKTKRLTAKCCHSGDRKWAWSSYSSTCARCTSTATCLKVPPHSWPFFETPANPWPQPFADVSAQGLITQALFLGDPEGFNSSLADCVWKRTNDRASCPDPAIEIILYTNSSRAPQKVVTTCCCRWVSASLPNATVVERVLFVQVSAV